MTTYIVDTETTDKDAPEVIELAYMRIAPEQDLAGSSDFIPGGIGDPTSACSKISNFYNQRYKPEKPTSFGALAVHHILPSELEGRPSSSEANIPDDCAYMIGHSIDYDWKALGSPDVKRICTRAMAEHVWPEADSYSQSALLYMLLGPTRETRGRLKNAHSALIDVVNNATLLQHILDAKPEITTWSALWDFSEECRIPLLMPITKARGEPLTAIDDGLLDWCLNQYWLPDEHPYLHTGLVREYKRRRGLFDPDPAGVDEDDDNDTPF